MAGRLIGKRAAISSTAAGRSTSTARMSRRGGSAMASNTAWWGAGAGMAIEYVTIWLRAKPRLFGFCETQHARNLCRPPLAREVRCDRGAAQDQGALCVNLADRQAVRSNPREEVWRKAAGRDQLVAFH